MDLLWCWLALLYRVSPRPPVLASWDRWGGDLLTSGMPLRPYVTGGDAWQFWPSPRRALTPTPSPRGGCRQAPCVMAWGRGAGGGQGGPGLGGFCPTECWEASERVGILLRGPGEEPRWLPVSTCVVGPRAVQGATVLAAGAGCSGPWGGHGGTRMRGVTRCPAGGWLGLTGANAKSS